jgi:hypothetical protein
MLKLNYLKLSRFIYVIALITLIPAFSLFAQNGTVKGNVSDTKGVAIPYANVVLMGTTMGAAADVNGNYVISNVPAGSYYSNSRWNHNTKLHFGTGRSKYGKRRNYRYTWRRWC